MTPKELKNETQWREILRKIQQETGMEASLTDSEGSILLEEGDRFPICKRIREKKEALTFICSQTNSAMLGEVKGTLKPAIEECEAGFLRIAIPIVDDGELTGQIVACGLRSEDFDPFLISKQLGISEEEAEDLAKESPLGEEEELEEKVSQIVGREGALFGG